MTQPQNDYFASDLLPYMLIEAKEPHQRPVNQRNLAPSDLLTALSRSRHSGRQRAPSGTKFGSPSETGRSQF